MTSQRAASMPLPPIDNMRPPTGGMPPKLRKRRTNGQRMENRPAVAQTTDVSNNETPMSAAEVSHVVANNVFEPLVSIDERAFVAPVIAPIDRMTFWDRFRAMQHLSDTMRHKAEELEMCARRLVGTMAEASAHIFSISQQIPLPSAPLPDGQRRHQLTELLVGPIVAITVYFTFSEVCDVPTEYIASAFVVEAFHYTRHASLFPLPDSLHNPGFYINRFSNLMRDHRIALSSMPCGPYVTHVLELHGTVETLQAMLSRLGLRLRHDFTSPTEVRQVFGSLFHNHVFPAIPASTLHE